MIQICVILMLKILSLGGDSVGVNNFFQYFLGGSQLMKRVISLFVVLTMLLSLVALAIPAASAATLDKNNVGIEIPYYSGKAYFREIGGKFPAQEYNNDEYEYEIHEMIEADEKSGDHIIILDGAINSKYGARGTRTGAYDEWGEPLFTISSKDAAQMKTTLPSAENTYYWHQPAGSNGLSGASFEQGLKAHVWLAWDETYLYLAAQVFDPDLNSLDKIGPDIWDGDAVQIRVDPDGPNSIVGGTGYDASKNNYPWASTERNGGGETYGGKVMNMGVGISTAGKVDVHDMAPRYSPSMEDGIDPDTALPTKVLTWHQNGAYAMADEYPMNPFGDAFGAVGMFNEYANVNGVDNRKSCTTDYEVAIPWTYMNGSYVEWDEATQKSTLHLVDDIPQVGDEYGVALAILNGAKGASGYNSWLTWGSGVCGAQMSDGDYMTAGGSNSMVLSSAELGTIKSNGSAMHEHNFSDPTCDQPYVCQTCGYKKGFSVGHIYKHEVISAPTATSDGLIRSTCTFCRTVVNTTVPREAATVYHDFSKETNNKDVYNTEWSSDGWNYLYVDDAGNPIFRGPNEGDRAGQQKNTVEYYEGRTVIDLSTGDPGSYFSTSNNWRDFAYSYDIRLTGTDIYDEDNHNYIPGIYHQFGGIIPTVNGNSYGLKYAAGFFPTESGSTKGTFRIYEAPGSVTENGLAAGSVFILAESEEIDLGTDWHNFTLGYETKSNTAIFYLDGEPVVGVWTPDLYMNNESQTLMIRRFHLSCMLADMKLGSPTAFNEAADVATYSVTVDGNVIGEYEAGATVTLTVPGDVELGTSTARFCGWNVVSGNAEVNKDTNTFVMPAANVEITAEYVISGDIDGDDALTARDYAVLRGIVADQIKASDVTVVACDVNGDGTVTTADVLALKRILAGE